MGSRSGACPSCNHSGVSLGGYQCSHRRDASLTAGFFVRCGNGVGEVLALCSETNMVFSYTDIHSLCFCVSLHHRKAGSRAEED